MTGTALEPAQLRRDERDRRTLAISGLLAARLRDRFGTDVPAAARALLVTVAACSPLAADIPSGAFLDVLAFAAGELAGGEVAA